MAPTFESEAALCAAFITWVREGNGGGGKRYAPWTVYPETAGFDLLLVDDEGHQLGIEAKLRMNAKVLAQAMPSRWGGEEGPDWRGILVPSINPDLEQLALLVGLVVFVPGTPVAGFVNDFRPSLYESGSAYRAWHDFNPAKRCPLPPMVPDLPAGVPAPVKLTMWKVAALKVLAHLELAGSITAREVRSYGVDPRRFCATDGWLQSAGGGNWTRGRVPAFDQQHPKEYAELRETVRNALAIGTPS